MQSQVPIRSYVYFFLTTFLLMVGYSRVREYLWPTPPPVEKLWVWDRAPREVQFEAITRLLQTPAGRGLADAVDFAFQYRRPPAEPWKPQPKWAYEQSSRGEQDTIIARMVLGTLDIAGIERAYVLNSNVLARHAAAGQPVDEITIGGEDFPITATMTPRGAGVAELHLNDFGTADKYGLPVLEDGKRKPVTLIPRNFDAPPAFSVFHYARPDDDEKRPLDTLGHVVWQVDSKVTDGNRHEVVYSTELPDMGVRIVKAFSLSKNEYHLGLNVRIEKIANAKNEKFRYQIQGGCGLPIEGIWYATIFRMTHVGLLDDRDVMYRLSADAASLARTGGSERYRRDDKRFVYDAVVNQYFASAIAVDNQQAPGVSPKFLQYARATVESDDPKQTNLDDITVRAITEAFDLSAPTEHRYVLYHGPVKVRQLSRVASAQHRADPALVDRYADTLHLSSLTDYGNFGWWTSAIVFFTNVVHWLVGVLHSFLPGGLAIICVTLIVRGCMFPMSRRQALNMQLMQEKMQKVAPEMKEIEKKFKDDFFAKQQAQRELYKKHNINPASGLSGCFMLFLQMPIFMGLYFALQESVFFRLEPFLWIRNLAAPDMLAWWGEKIPMISDPASRGSLLYLGPYLNILPLIGAVLIFVQQQKSMPPTMTDEQRQQYQIMKFMTGFMALMFYKIASGLSLYFIVSSLWGLAERRIVKKHIEKTTAERAAGIASKQKTKPVIKQPSRFALWWEKLLKEASKK